MSDETVDLTQYDAFGTASEFWVVGGLPNIVCRFGPFTKDEVGPIMERAVDDNIRVTIIMQCGRAIDWRFLEDATRDMSFEKLKQQIHSQFANGDIDILERDHLLDEIRADETDT